MKQQVSLQSRLTFLTATRCGVSAYASMILLIFEILVVAPTFDLKGPWAYNFCTVEGLVLMR
jgi:hypothetical protein